MTHRPTARIALWLFAGTTAFASIASAKMDAAADASPAITSPPVLNNNQPVLNSGPTVALFWAPPAVGVAISYIIEASSVPGGPADLANFNTGSVLTSLIVPGVPFGTYYVRIRAVDETGSSDPSNEVQVVVGGGSSCPSAPRGLSVISQSGGTIVIGWEPPLSGSPTSYVVQAGSFPNGTNLANFDTGSTALALTATNVPTGSYFVRVYSRNGSCVPPAFLGASSNEILLSVGAGPSGWRGPITCRTRISGPGGYHHDETQTWIVGGSGHTVGPRTFYPVHWSAQGAGGATGKSWTINSTAMTDFTVTIVASTGVPIFDRTTTPIIIRDGLVGTPISFDLHEIEFPTIVAGSATATSVSGTWSRATVGGDSPQQPSGSTGTLSCTWSLTFR